MKTHRRISLLLTLAASVVFTAPVFADGAETAPASGFAPKEFALSRYAELDKKSPFEFDPPPVKTETGPDPFADVSLAGYCGSGNTLTVYIIAGGKERKRMTVYGDGSPYKKRDESGYRVIGINRGKSLKTTTVTLERDGVQKELSFDAETLSPKGGGAAPGGGVQMMQGPDGKMVPRPMVPRPSNMPAGQNQQAYQAPAPFFPGQSGNQQPQGNQPGVNMNNALQQAQQAGTMNNQQLLNHLVGPNGQPATSNPNAGLPVVGGTLPGGVTPGGVAPVGNQTRGSLPPQRRRVVLPTGQ